MGALLFAVTTDLNYDQRMQRICGALAERGHQVELVGRVLPTSEPLLRQPYTQHRLHCFFHRGKLFYLEFMLRLYIHLLHRSYSAYCAIDLDTALPVYFSARRARKPFVYDAHEYFPEIAELTNRPAVKAVWTAVEKFVLIRTRHAYTVTQSIAAILTEKYGLAFEVIRNVPPLICYEPVPKQPRTILYQGALNKGRGLEQLLHAMVGVDARLVICGDGDLREELQVLAQQLNITHKTEFRGKVLPNDLLHITRTACVGVMLLENAGLSYYYSLANKFFDYIHAGVPQVVVDFPEYRQLNERYQVAVYCSLQVAVLQEKLNLLLSDTELYRQLEANCRLARKELNWQEEEKKLWRFYETLLEI